MRNRSTCLLLALVALVGVLALPATASAARLARPAHAWLDVATASSATLRWTPVARARSYVVRRNGVRVAVTRRTAIRITGLAPATYSTFQVVASARGITASAPSDPIPVATRAPSGCTHYVSSTGSNGADGTSAATAWRTISQLVERWRPGWVGCLEGHFVEDVSIFRGGTSTSKVVLRERPGASASIRGRIWTARGADHVVISGLRLDGRAVDDTARNSLPSPTVNAVGTMLLGNDISNSRTRVCAVLGSINGYGVAIEPVLAYNRIHDCGRRGANTHHGIYVESARRARIIHNAIFDNADRGIQLYPDARDSLIAGNVIDANGTGIIFSGAEGYASSRNIVLRNVISNSQLRSNLEHWWENPQRPGVGNIAVRNCLGGARQGNIALPTVGYVARDNSTGRLAWRDRRIDDLRPVAGSGCLQLLRSRMLPLAPR